MNEMTRKLKFYLDTFDAFDGNLMDGLPVPQHKRFIKCGADMDQAIDKGKTIMRQSSGGTIWLKREIQGQWGVLDGDYGETVGCVFRNHGSGDIQFEGDQNEIN